MNVIKSSIPTPTFSLDMIKSGAEFELCCCVHKIKKRSGFTFVTLRTGRHTIVAVHNPKYTEKPLKNVFEGVYLKVRCFVRDEIKAQNGLEIAITDYTILSKPQEKYNMPVSDRIIDLSPEELVEGRCLSFRNPTNRSVGIVFDSIVNSFCRFMRQNGFVKVSVPFIAPWTFEKEKDSLSLDYFGEKAYLCADPSLYLEKCVAYYDRVFGVNKVFFGKKRNSPRLLCEYTSLQFQLAYPKVQEEMSVLAALIKKIVCDVSKDCKYELGLLEVKMPEAFDIPMISFSEAMELLKKPEDQPDLDPTDERRICAWAKEKFGCDFVFVKGLNPSKRPVYFKDSFVLLFRGVEIASGGERFYEYNDICEALQSKGFSPKEWTFYTDYHKYGMPPHSSVGLGAERFLMQLLGFDNIRKAVVFPRDIHTVSP